MVNRDGALASLHRRTPGHAATVIIPLQHFLTTTPEVSCVLTLERVARRAQALRHTFGRPQGQCITICFGFVISGLQPSAPAALVL